MTDPPMTVFYTGSYLNLTALVSGDARMMRQFQHTLAMQRDFSWLGLGLGTTIDELDSKHFGDHEYIFCL